MRYGRNDGGLVVIPSDRADPGGLPQTRPSPVGRHQQPSPEARFAARQSKHGPLTTKAVYLGIQDLHPCNACGVEQGTAQPVLEHHGGEGLVGFGLAVEFEEDRAGRIVVPAVRDDHVDHRLRLLGDSLPDTEAVKKAARARRDRDGAQGAGSRAGTGEARIRDGHAGSTRSPAQREREGKTGNATPRHEDILRFAHRTHPR